MSVAGEEETNSISYLVSDPDPLLKAGAYIDPDPSFNGITKPDSISDPPTTPKPSDRQDDLDPPQNDLSVTSRPDWLPPGWKFIERVRSSGASAGSRDKYYLDPVTNRRFRSKKEVFHYLETGSLKKKNVNSDADNTNLKDFRIQTNSQTPNKRKKAEAKAKELSKYFDFDDIPAKVKWVLSDIYEGSWRPLINGIERVPESSKQEWAAAFTYLTLQNGGRSTF